MSDELLQELRRRLDGIADVPVEERPELFEEAHRAVVAELNALEEV